jgi:integrase
VFKKKNFQQTTRHKDKRNASIAAATIIAGWQKDVDEARGNPDAVVNKLATLKALDRKERDLQQFAYVEPADKESDAPAVHGVNGIGWTGAELTADAYLDQLAETLPESEYRYYANIYHGRSGVPNGFFVKEWIDSQHGTNTPRTRTEAKKAAKLAAQWFPTTTDWTTGNRTLWLQSETRNRKSVQKDVGYVRSFFMWLQDNYFIDASAVNPFAKDSFTYPKQLKKPGELNRREANPNEITDLLLKVRQKGDTELERFIIVGVLTGLRLGEIAAVTNKSIINQRGVRCIKVRSDAKTNASSDRLVPLCKGLMDYDWPKQASNDMAVGKRFGRLKSAAGYGRDLVFHSLRKTYATTCEQLGIPEGIAADILGHEKETMTYGLYSGGTSVEQKKEAVEKVAEYLSEEIDNLLMPAT